MTEEKLLDEMLGWMLQYPDWFGRYLAIQAMKEHFSAKEADVSALEDAAFDAGYQEAVRDHDDCVGLEYCEWEGY
jgi:hypothetical protein